METSDTLLPWNNFLTAFLNGGNFQKYIPQLTEEFIRVKGKTVYEVLKKEQLVGLP